MHSTEGGGVALASCLACVTSSTISCTTNALRLEGYSQETNIIPVIPENGTVMCKNVDVRGGIMYNYIYMYMCMCLTYNLNRKAKSTKCSFKKMKIR